MVNIDAEKQENKVIREKFCGSLDFQANEVRPESVFSHLYSTILRCVGQKNAFERICILVCVCRACVRACVMMRSSCTHSHIVGHLFFSVLSRPVIFVFVIIYVDF